MARREDKEFRVVFFFQAEDGIRDGRVTGVQTCALPILSEKLGPRVLGHNRDMPFLGREMGNEPDYSEEIGRASCRKECRSGGSTDRYKKRKGRRSSTARRGREIR